MKIKLEYGKTGLEIDVDDDRLVGVLGLKNVDPLPDPVARLRERFSHPIGGQPLQTTSANKQTACIVICDITRPVPNEMILTPLLADLESWGVPREGITILIATGTHRPNEGDELDLLVGKTIAANYRCLNHYCRDTEDMVDFGMSPNKVPVLLNRHYVHAELKITIGMIEPHFMAGFAGGRKMVMPGVAGLETVQAWHSPRFLEHPLATNGAVHGNPVHEESLAIAKMCPPDFVIDVALNSHRKVWEIFAGDLEEAWFEGVRQVSETTVAEVPEPVDIVVTSSAGYPLDLTYYQTVKGMVGALPIVKPGGWIIIASENAEGVGNHHFLEAILSLDSIEDFPIRCEEPGWTFVADQWQIEELSKAVRGAKIGMVSSGIPTEYKDRLFVKPFDTVEEGIAFASKDLGENASIAVIPKGPYVIVRVQ